MPNDQKIRDDLHLQELNPIQDVALSASSKSCNFHSLSRFKSAYSRSFNSTCDVNFTNCTDMGCIRLEE
jgi:hypothetical protein